MEHLSESQQQALSQLREITNGGDDEVAVGVLSSVEWDVQRAAEMIFGTASTSTPNLPSSPPRRPIETFDVDDSYQGTTNSPEEPTIRERDTTSSLLTLTRPLVSLLAFPFHIISNVLRFIFGILRIPFPQFRFSGLNFYRPLRPRPSSAGGPDRWVRELEEETGAVCIGRLKTSRGATSSVAVDSSSSSLTARTYGTTSPNDDGRKLLPDFTLGGYEETLKSCQRDAKIACVILVSEEHDDVAEFKRSTLTDLTFVKTLYDNDIVVWGGDVRHREAWSAAEKLQATTYPFVAFIALQPRRSPASSSSSRPSSPTLTVLSRHQGRCVPATGPTSAATLVDHLERQVLPRVKPFLERIRASQRERERDRMLREEQDRAFHDAARRDKQRIEAKMAAERAQIEATRKAEEDALAEQRRRETEAENTKKREATRMDWRRWTRRAVVGPEYSDPKTSLRVAIRLPSGGRVIRSFPPSATLTSLYSFVDAQLIPSHFSPNDDPISPPEGVAGGEEALEQQIVSMSDAADWWGFDVTLAYPRTEIPWKSGIRLSDIQPLKGGGQVVVELRNSVRRSLADRSPTHNTAAQDDDGYDTEDSE
ncbi:hypothetical protein BDQ12DRAFT_221041 [Crucibulum laeve]|uniref:UBX domain-containing protein n=1 Tax=Crucibulum laeve TaxID=68775 RepID=A0A5C3LWZ9_9AGAR|nr:hypothetical protein BDQ12DRAFT_221041 [Crucibulum laeve]